jgi:hypothetical protein
MTDEDWDKLSPEELLAGSEYEPTPEEFEAWAEACDKAAKEQYKREHANK